MRVSASCAVMFASTLFCSTAQYYDAWILLSSVLFAISPDCQQVVATIGNIVGTVISWRRAGRCTIRAWADAAVSIASVATPAQAIFEAIMARRRISFRFLPIPCSLLDDWIGDRRLRLAHIACYMAIAEAEYAGVRPRPLTQAEIAARAKIARRTAQNALDDLHQLGLIESQGIAKRARYYRLRPVRNVPEIVPIRSARKDALPA